MGDAFGDAEEEPEREGTALRDARAEELRDAVVVGEAKGEALRLGDCVGVPLWLLQPVPEGEGAAVFEAAGDREAEAEPEAARHAR